MAGYEESFGEISVDGGTSGHVVEMTRRGWIRENDCVWIVLIVKTSSA